MTSSTQAPVGSPEWLRDLWERGWLKGVLLVAGIVLAYQPVWHAGFIWDDDAHVTRPELRSLSGLASIWIRLGATQQYYPLAHSVFWMEHRLWGDATPGYHLANILMHALAALLLVKILWRLKIPGPWLAGAIFALHPVQVETVAWVSELKNTLSAVFYLGAVLAYLRFDRTRAGKFYALALGLFLLGLMSKTVIATLPAVFLVIFWWQRGNLSWKQDMLPLLPFFAAGIGAGLFTAWVERKYIIGSAGPAFHYSIVERMLIAGRAIWFYLGKLFWPADLTFVYPRWNVSQTIWWQYAYPVGALLLLVVAWRISRRNRGPLAGLLFFVGTLFPALGFFNVYPFRYSFVADHFQYLAAIGPITLAAAGITLMAGKANRFVGPTFCGLLLLSLGLLTWQQSRMYVNAETLWRATISRNPGCAMAYNNLGILLQRRGQVDEALADFQRAVALQADHEENWVSLGGALVQKGQLDKAIVYLKKALGIRPDYVEGLNDLGYAYYAKGMPDEAIAQFQKAVELQPGDEPAQANLGEALLREGRLAEAIVHLQKALELKPRDLKVVNRLAWILATSPDASVRNGAKAVELAERAVQLSGGADPTSICTLAAADAEAGRFSEAVETAQQAQRLAATLNNTALVNALQTQIQLYQAGSAFCDISLTNIPAKAGPP